MTNIESKVKNLLLSINSAMDELEKEYKDDETEIASIWQEMKNPNIPETSINNLKQRSRLLKDKNDMRKSKLSFLRETLVELEKDQWGEDNA